MEQLQITVLKRSNDFNQTINISVLSTKHIFKTSLNGLLFLRPMIHVTCFFLKYQTGVTVDHNFEINHMTVVKLFFFQRKFSLLFSKCLFKASLNGFYDLKHMIRVVYIFVKYQTAAIAGHNLEVIR